VSAHRFDVRGRVAIVTGATKGLGYGIARGFAEAGAQVVVSSRSQERCDDVAEALAEEYGVETLALACHMGEWNAIPGFVDAVYERFGRVDAVVNNAGINPRPTFVVDMTTEYWDKLFAVNLKGPLRLAMLVAPRMAEQGGGAIVNIATMGAYSGVGLGNSAYSASKAALLNLTRAMASEWASKGIRVNAISPGPFVTEMMKGTAKFDEQFMERSARATLMRRLAEPDEIVGAVLYLCSDAASYVTGEDHIVAGGMQR